MVERERPGVYSTAVPARARSVRSTDAATALAAKTPGKTFWVLALRCLCCSTSVSPIYLVAAGVFVTTNLVVSKVLLMPSFRRVCVPRLAACLAAQITQASI